MVSKEYTNNTLAIFHFVFPKSVFILGILEGI